MVAFDGYGLPSLSPPTPTHTSSSGIVLVVEFECDVYVDGKKGLMWVDFASVFFGCKLLLK